MMYGGSVAALLVSSCLVCSCGRATPPPGVPAQAVNVPIAKDWGWAHCWLDQTAKLNRCRVYNAGGVLLHRFRHDDDDDDDVFVPYEGLAPVPEGDLKIDAKRTSNPWTVYLVNGAILLPRNDFETQKRWVDFVKGKRESLF